MRPPKAVADLITAISWPSPEKAARALDAGAPANPGPNEGLVESPLYYALVDRPMRLSEIVHMSKSRLVFSDEERADRIREMKESYKYQKQIGPARYEEEIRKVARVLLDRGADVTLADEQGYTITDHAWTSTDGRPKAASEIILETVRRDPSYQPNFPDLFLTSLMAPYDPSALQGRRDMARYMMEMGRQVTARLGDANDSTGTAARRAMSPTQLSFWLNNPWQLDPRKMPWAPLEVFSAEIATHEAFRLAARLGKDGFDFTSRDVSRALRRGDKKLAKAHTALDIRRTQARRSKKDDGPAKK